MAYLSLLNHFWRLDRDIHFSPNETRLYMFILNRFNVQGWRCKQIEMTQPEAMSQCGLTLRGLKAARDRLKHFGLIDFKIGGNGRVDKTTYLIPEKGVQKCTPLAKEKGCKNATLIPEKGVQKCTPLAKENTPIPLKENINIYIQEGERDAHARTREGRVFIDSLKRDPLWLEESIRACAGVEDSFDEICLRVVQQWEAFGEDFGARDARKKFRNWLLKEADGLRRKLASAKSEPLQERKRKFRDEIAEAAQTLDAASETLNDFYQYWTQPTPDGGSLAFETKTFWDTKSRLHRWIQKERTRGA